MSWSSASFRGFGAFLYIPPQSTTRHRPSGAKRNSNRVNTIYVSNPKQLPNHRTSIQVRSTSTIRVSTPLPPRNRAPLPRPSPFPPMTRHTTHRPHHGRGNKRRRNRNRTKRNKTKSRNRRNTRNGKYSNKDGGSRATLFYPNRGIQQRPGFKRGLPRGHFLPKAMGRRQRLQKTTTHHRRSQPTPRRPNGKKGTSINGTSLITLRPTLRPIRPTTTTTSLNTNIPSLMIRHLRGTTRRTRPRRGTKRNRRPNHANKRPPHHRPNRGISLHGNRLVTIQTLLHLPSNRRGRHRHKGTINPRRPRHYPLTTFKPIRTKNLSKRRLINRVLHVNPTRTRNRNTLFQLTRKVRHRPTNPNRPMVGQPFSNRNYRQDTPRHPIRPRRRLPIRTRNTTFIREPTTHIRSSPTRHASRRGRSRVLPRHYPRHHPITLGRRTRRQRRVRRRHFTRSPRNNGKIRAVFNRKTSSTETRTDTTTYTTNATNADAHTPKTRVADAITPTDHDENRQGY